jgi:MerR family transcriptional regulator, thiopeptide resistance regulator
MSTFRIQEFAKLAGVTVRTLHHYDRVGLLSPAHRSERGYRLYCHEDLGRVERILVLRYLGLSLREIAALLQQSVAPETLAATLARQRAVLRDRRDELTRILGAIEHAQSRAATSAEPEWLLYQSILKEIQMEQTHNWTEKYYSPKGLEALRERHATITLAAVKELQAKWKALHADIQDALDRGTSPDSAEGRALVARWMRLADEFTQGNPDLSEGLHRLYQDENNWPDDEKAASLRANSASPQQRQFFLSAVQACLRHG